MKHSIKRMLSLLAAAALLGSTMLAYAAEAESTGKKKKTKQERWL